jgi:dihydrodipicolinate synthase/N-acetylneuraminate lyase
MLRCFRRTGQLMQSSRSGHEQRGAMKIEGVIPALPTPFTSDGQLDESGLARLVQHVITGGVHGLWALGSTSEFPGLDRNQRDRIVEICVQKAEGRVPVIVGVGDLDERVIIKNSEEAERAGASACFATLPYYYTLDSAESVQYLRRIASAVSLPFVFYDNPFSTNVRLSRDAMLEVASIPNLIAIKESSCDFRRFIEVAETFAGKAPAGLLQGIEQLAGPSLLLGGACGVVMALASVVPSLFVELYETALKGDVAQLRRLQGKVLRLCRLYEVKGAATDGAFFAGLKAALEVAGVCARHTASPFTEMPPEKMKDVEAIFAECQSESISAHHG